MRTIARVSILAALSLLACNEAWSMSGREIMDSLKERENSTRNWFDRSQRLTLKIFRRSDKPRLKEMKLYEKKYADGKKKALVFFLAPAEIRGTGFLQWSDPDTDDKQWLYLPQFKRLRRISARAKHESFAGSDFTYRDLELLNQLANWSEGRGNPKLAGEEEVEGVPCYLVELHPREKSTGYDRLRVWVSKRDFQVHKIELEDTRQELKKVLLLKDFRVVDGISTSHWSEMRNLKKGTRTVVETRELRYNMKLKDDFFTGRTLENGER